MLILSFYYALVYNPLIIKNRKLTICKKYNYFLNNKKEYSILYTYIQYLRHKFFDVKS